MSINLEDTNTALRNLIRSLLGMSEGGVRPANQNAPTGNLKRPDGSPNQFVTVLLSAVESRGWDSTSYANEAAPSANVTETVSGQRDVAVSIQIFRGDALSKAERLRGLLQSSAAVLALQSLGLGVKRIGSVINLTAIVDTYWEERSQLQAEFVLLSTEQSSVPTYGRFPVTIETENSRLSTEVTTQ